MKAANSKALVLPLESFYKEFAEPYSVIADDRDFKMEARELLRLIGRTDYRNLKVAELFAGPAYHSQAFGVYGVHSICLEESAAMIKIAQERLENGSHSIIQGRLPSRLAHLDASSIHLAIAMRYSLGCLDRPGVLCLLNELERVLVPGGAVVFELHNLGALEENLRRLEIRSRVGRLADGRDVRCEWPHGSLKWSAGNKQVKMEVLLEILKNGQLEERIIFDDFEHVYSVNDVHRIAWHHTGLLPEPTVPLWSGPSMQFAVLRKGLF